MEIGLIIVVCVLVVVNIIFNAIVFKKHTSGAVSPDFLNAVSAENKREFENMFRLIQQNNDSQLKLLQLYQETVSTRMNDLNNVTDKNLLTINEKMKDLTQNLSENLKQIQTTNEKKLDEMRITVGEKLDTTLNERLNQNVKVIAQQLDTFISGISEVKNLSSGVVDLKNILGNIKNRGTFGEVQLGSLLEQMLAPNQYASQVDINNNGERVDFAIYFPAKDGKTLLLPIDAKFPMEDYKNLQDSIDKGDQDAIKNYQKQLMTRIKKEAKDIKSKYISVPQTTPFAFMYLPTENLYAEVIREVGLFEELQRDYHITVCGPSTISAVLNALQMGFKTLAIEKKSGEIWNVLSQFRKDFEVFIELLSKTQKKLTEASNDIENATHRSQLIKKRLNRVDDISDDLEPVKLKEIGKD